MHDLSIVGVAALLLAACGVPGLAGAQTQSPAFGDLPRLLRPGDPVVVTDAAGRKTKGRVREAQASSLVLELPATIDRGRRIRTFLEPDVTTVARTDSVINGTLIGLAAGAAAAWAFLRGNCGAPGYDPECSAIAGPVGLLIFLPAGSVAGALVDRAIGNQVLYRASPASPSGVTVVPWLGQGAKGARISLRY